MSTDAGPSRARQAVDAIGYAVAVAALVTAAALLAATVAFDDRSGGVVVLTFVAGWLITGYGILQLRPRAAWKSDDPEDGVDPADSGTDGTTASDREETAFQSAVRSLPPLRWYPIPPDRRLPDRAKVVLAGIAVLAVSLGVDVVAHW